MKRLLSLLAAGAILGATMFVPLNPLHVSTAYGNEGGGSDDDTVDPCAAEQAAVDAALEVVQTWVSEVAWAQTQLNGATEAWEAAKAAETAALNAFIANPNATTAAALEAATAAREAASAIKLSWALTLINAQSQLSAAQFALQQAMAALVDCREAHPAS